MKDLVSCQSVLHALVLSALKDGQDNYAREIISNLDFMDDDEREGLFQGLAQALHQENSPNVDDNEMSTEPNTGIKSPAQDDEVRTGLTKKTATENESAPKVPVKYTKRRESQKDYGIEENKPAARPPMKNSEAKSLRRSPMPSKQRPTASTGMYKRAAALLTSMYRFISALTKSASRNPTQILQFVLFLVALIAAMSRRDVKEKLKQALEKVKGTLGMGVKVSYI